MVTTEESSIRSGTHRSIFEGARDDEVIVIDDRQSDGYVPWDDELDPQTSVLIEDVVSTWSSGDYREGIAALPTVMAWVKAWRVLIARVVADSVILEPDSRVGATGHVERMVSFPSSTIHFDAPLTIPLRWGVHPFDGESIPSMGSPSLRRAVGGHPMLDQTSRSLCRDQSMYLNKIVVLVACVWTGLLLLLVFFDPTRDYPTMSIEIELIPNEVTTISVPTEPVAFLGWLGMFLRNPLLWVDTNVEGLEVVGYLSDLLPDTVVGFDPYIGSASEGSEPAAVSGELTILNKGNATVLATITTTFAPSPATIGSSSSWLYLAFGLLEIIVASILAMVKPVAQVNIRPAARGSIGEHSGQTEHKSRLTKFRELLSRVGILVCLRKSGTGGSGVAMV